MDGGNVTVDRLAELAQMGNLRIPSIGNLIKRLNLNKQLIAWINKNPGYSISDKYYSKIDIWLDSSTTEKGKKYLLLEVHTLDGNGCYVIENRRFLAENDQLVEAELPAQMIRRFATGSPVPWFAIFMPNIDNNAEDNNGLGVSIIHGAIDTLKAIDLCRFRHMLLCKDDKKRHYKRQCSKYTLRKIRSQQRRQKRFADNIGQRNRTERSGGLV